VSVIGEPTPFPAEAAAARPPLARGAWWVAAAIVALHLVAIATAYGVFRDEFYYLACARRLGWGYVDHPPVSIAILALDRALFGEGLFALRWIPALAAGALVVLGAALARELGGGRRAQVLSALAIAAAPVNRGICAIYSMNAFEPLAWTGLAFLVARLACGAGERVWLAIGLLAGVGMLTKHSVAFFVLTLLAGALATPLRARFASRGFLGALALAALVVAPHVDWQARHGWPTLEFLRNAAALKNAPVTPLEFLQGQFLNANPVGAGLALVGLAALLAAPSMRPYRGLGIAALATTGGMMALQAKSYYLAPLYSLLFAGGAVAVERRLTTRARGALALAYGATLAAAGLATVPFALPVLSPERFLAYARGVGIEPPRDERHEAAALPQHYADCFGWRELAQAVSRVYAALPEEDRERSVVYVHNYGEAGALEYFAREFPLPPVCSGHNNYFLWGLPDRPLEVALIVGGEREDHLEEFGEVEEAAQHDHPLAMPYERRLRLFVARRPRLPLREAFARTRKYV
jgi:dolichyl-phosphate-mannose-protein mannosyltransferase